MSTVAVALAAAAAVMSLAGQLRSPAEDIADRPRVVATSPATGATLAPGPFTLHITFDQPMRGDSYSFVATDVASYPDCEQTPQQSSDRRSFTLRCTGKAGQRYAIGFNYGRFRNFVSLKGNLPATSAVLTFRVK